MTHDDEDDSGMKDLTNRQVMKIVMQELVDVRRELIEQITDVKRELKQDIVSLDGKLVAVDHRLTKRIDNIGFKLDQNTIALMANINDHEKRITRLEVAAA